MPAQILITPVPELFVLFRGPSEAGGSVDAECIHPLEVVQGALRRLSRRAQVQYAHRFSGVGARGFGGARCSLRCCHMASRPASSRVYC